MPSLHVSEAPRNNWSDDEPLEFGGVVKLLYETADANANVLTLVFPEGGATDVPGLVIGDASIENVDLGWFNGLTEPFIAIVNDAADAYVRLDAGDDAVAGSKGLYYKAAADEDIELENLSVTGTPRRYWDESEDMYRQTKGLVIDAKGLFIGDTADANVTLGLVINQGAADDTIVSLKSSDVAHGKTGIETDTFASFGKAAGPSGGLRIKAITDADIGFANPFYFEVYAGGNAITTKSTAAEGIVHWYIGQHSGGATANVVADGDLFTIAGYVGGTWVTGLILDEDGDLWIGGTINAISAYQVNGTQVMGAQGAAVADVSDGLLATTITQLNALLARVRTHGLIAT